MPRFERPSAISCSTSLLPRQSARPPAGAARWSRAAGPRRRGRRPSRPDDHADGRDQRLPVGDPLLEQVARRAAGGQGPYGQGRAGVHRQQQHADRRCPRPAAPRAPASPRRCGRAASGCRGRGRRRRRARRAAACIAATSPATADDVAATGGQQLPHALADQHGIVDDDDPRPLDAHAPPRQSRVQGQRHGDRRTGASRPHDQRAAAGVDPVHETAQARCPGRRAPRLRARRRSTLSRSGSTSSTTSTRPGCRGVLGDVGQALGHHEVRRGRGRLVGLTRPRDPDGRRHGRAQRQLLQGVGEAAVDQGGRCDPGGDLAQLGQRLVELVRRVVQDAGDVASRRSPSSPPRQRG